ncbi:MAG TPA: polyribonucleotide nucleotidyltransferase [Tepidisphaeraceae bacterium]|jgi:polyribonucleotide nucleotidyltransferase|nr:polyribonucleotide nucleotidyltransferase [Tepidisphaeraceae bacterium]
MQSIRVERQIGGRTLAIETGTLAKLADGAVTVQFGDTVVFGAVVRASPREGIDFFPLQVDYRERRAAAGKFPGGFMKREGRPTTKEVLTARLIDRPLRPLFPKGFMDEVQIHLNALAFDGENDPDILAGLAASSALAISDIPFTLPTAHVRVGRVEGKLVLNPTVEQLEYSDFDLVVAGTKNAVNMIELGGREVGEDDVADAIEFGHKAIIEIVGAIEELVKKAGREKVGDIKHPDAGFVDAIRARVTDKIREVKGRPGKQDRSDAVKQILTDLIAEMAPPITDPNASYQTILATKDKQKQIRGVFSEVEETATREAILTGVRPDGRGFKDIRPITCSVGVLPRVHGSSVFSRGETQAMCTITLGTSSDEQMVDGLIAEYGQKFMLHYNFPSYSVGEVRPIRGPGRREIGHGALAERSLIAVLPAIEQFPYTVRIISDILESNGSSSMATACGGCLALMDAGVPISKPVAGISVGLVQEGNKKALLTDILGEEDHFGDMDFKVVGTRDGITAIQLDIKIEGLHYDTIRETLHRAKEARLIILEKMAAVLPGPRKEISKWAPRLLTVKINPEKIGKLIGPGGKNIKAIQEKTGANIDIEDDGTVYISSVDAAAAEKCRDIVEAMMAEVKVGKIYNGTVVSIKDFGAFVEIAPETDGLCHVSELSNNYVQNVNDVVAVGDAVKVKVILIDDQGRIKLSRKAAMQELGETDPEPVGAPSGGGGGREDRGHEDRGDFRGPPRGDRGGDRGDRGPRRDDRGGGDRGPRPDRGGDRGDRGPSRGPAPRQDRGPRPPRDD